MLGINVSAGLQGILHKQQTGDPRPLWCLCTTFLSLLRELSALLNSPLGFQGEILAREGPGHGPAVLGSEGVWADLEDVQMTESEKAIFKHFLTDKLPLIGDYAYNAVARNLEEKRMKGEEKVLMLEEYLKEPGVESKCLYTHVRSHISGPWIPHRDAKGRVHLVEMKR